MLLREEGGGSRNLPLTGIYFGVGFFFLGKQKHATCDKSPFLPHPDFRTQYFTFPALEELIILTGLSSIIYFQVCFSVISVSILMSIADPL